MFLRAHITTDGVRDAYYGLLCIAIFVAEPRSVGPHTPEEERVFQDTDTMFKGAIICVLADSRVDAYVTLRRNLGCT